MTASDLKIKKMILSLVNSDLGYSKTQVINTVAKLENLNKSHVRTVYDLVKKGQL